MKIKLKRDMILQINYHKFCNASSKLYRKPLKNCNSLNYCLTKVFTLVYCLADGEIKLINNAILLPLKIHSTNHLLNI